MQADKYVLFCFFFPCDYTVALFTEYSIVKMSL